MISLTLLRDERSHDSACNNDIRSILRFIKFYDNISETYFLLAELTFLTTQAHLSYTEADVALVEEYEEVNRFLAWPKAPSFPLCCTDTLHHYCVAYRRAKVSPCSREECKIRLSELCCTSGSFLGHSCDSHYSLTFVFVVVYIWLLLPGNKNNNQVTTLVTR
jgi:hypothetical protein